MFINDADAEASRVLGRMRLDGLLFRLTSVSCMLGSVQHPGLEWTEILW